MTDSPFFIDIIDDQLIIEHAPTGCGISLPESKVELAEIKLAMQTLLLNEKILDVRYGDNSTL